MKDFQDVTMSSLIAGYFLAKETRIIEFNAITNLLNDLYMCENIDVMETDEDIDKLGIIILFDDKSVILNYDFNEIVNINGTNITVYDYLYSLTNEWVRNYLLLSSFLLDNIFSYLFLLCDTFWYLLSYDFHHLLYHRLII